MLLWNRFLLWPVFTFWSSYVNLHKLLSCLYVAIWISSGITIHFPCVLRFVTTRQTSKDRSPRISYKNLPDCVEHTLDLILYGSWQRRAFNPPQITCYPILPVEQPLRVTHINARVPSPRQPAIRENVVSVSGLPLFGVWMPKAGVWQSRSNRSGALLIFSAGAAAREQYGPYGPPRLLLRIYCRRKITSERPRHSSSTVCPILSHTQVT